MADFTPEQQAKLDKMIVGNMRASSKTPMVAVALIISAMVLSVWFKGGVKEYVEAWTAFLKGKTPVTASP